MERYFIIVPCYNEEEVLPETIKRLGDCLDKLVERGYASPDSRVLFVNDGSADRTSEIITDAYPHDERFAGLSGEEAAAKAAGEAAACQAAAARAAK